jgi:hypothetical protein
VVRNTPKFDDVAHRILASVMPCCSTKATRRASCFLPSGRCPAVEGDATRIRAAQARQMRSSEDLPQPLGPSSPTVSPRETRSETLLTMTFCLPSRYIFSAEYSSLIP